jgi:hypothetical protein
MALPTSGEGGAAADALAHELERSIDLAAWDRTGAIEWDWKGQHHLLWDRARNRAEVRWGDRTVALDLGSRTGRAMRGGSAVAEAEQKKMLDKAYALWANDSFWLNPIEKLFDQGVERRKVPLSAEDGGGFGLLVGYTQGGVTPGDHYLWIPSKDGPPKAWRMWVSVVPIPGVLVRWEGWKQLGTGAWVAQHHPFDPLPLDVEIGDVRAASTLSELLQGKADPFAAL